MKFRPTPEESEWTIEKREVVKETKWNRYVHDSGKTVYGKDFDYFYLQIQGSATVIGLSDGKLILVKQYRYPTAKWSLELPGGGINDGDTAEQTAKQELLQETGYEPKSLMKLGELDVMNGYSSDIATVYFAPECIKVADQQLEETEQGTTVELIPVEEVFEMVQEGKVTDAFTLAALMLAFPHIL